MHWWRSRREWIYTVLTRTTALLVIALSQGTRPELRQVGQVPRRARKWRRAAATCVAAALLAGCWSSSASAPGDGQGRLGSRSSPAALAGVVDGDTITVRAGGGEESVRLIGINAPEQGECLAEEAGQTLAALLQQGPLHLEADTSDRDQYGRLLRYVYAGDVLVNEELVARGLALARRYEPDTARSEQLEAAQQRAQQAEAGMWAPDACGEATGARIEIVEVNFDAPGDDALSLNGEWVTLRNAGSDGVDLSGWVLKDTSASHRFAFPDGFQLPPGATVRVYSGCGAARHDALYWCVSGSAVWNNDGDTAFVLDPRGNVVATWQD